MLATLEAIFDLASSSTSAFPRSEGSISALSAPLVLESSAEGRLCPLQFHSVWIGLSGCDTPKDSDEMEGRLRGWFLPPTKVLVTNDALLLSSPIIRNGSSWGVAVVAGTGSVVIGMRVKTRSRGAPEAKQAVKGHSNENGFEHRKGTGIPDLATNPDEDAGWDAVEPIVRRGGQGHLFGGDAGSGYHLGLTAAQFAADDADFKVEREGGLAKEVRDYWGCSSTADVPTALARLDVDVDPVASSNRRKLRVSSFAPRVLAHYTSRTPCPLAIRIVHHCARALAENIALVSTRSQQFIRESLKGATLSLTGGVIEQECYRTVVIAELATLGIVFSHVDIVMDAAAEGVAAMAAFAIAKERP